MSDVKAVRVDHWKDLVAPGSFMFDEGMRSLIYVCPCGCGSEGALTLRPVREGSDPHPSWEWNGNPDLPSLTPSILRTLGCKWHGYLTDGVFRPC